MPKACDKLDDQWPLTTAILASKNWEIRMSELTKSTSGNLNERDVFNLGRASLINLGIWLGICTVGAAGI